jgi:hypothetical protein
MPVEKTEMAAKAAGIANRTLRRTRESLQIVVEKSDFEGGWQWRLP